MWCIALVAISPWLLWLLANVSGEHSPRPYGRLVHAKDYGDHWPWKGSTTQWVAWKSYKGHSDAHLLVELEWAEECRDRPDKNAVLAEIAKRKNDDTWCF